MQHQCVHEWVEVFNDDNVCFVITIRSSKIFSIEEAVSVTDSEFVR